MANLVPAGSSAIAANPFSHATYSIKRPFFTFLGRTFKVFDPTGNMCLYVKLPVFKLKQEWNVYADESQQQMLLLVKAREMIAMNPTSDVFDAQTNQKLGAFRSHGLKSIIHDTWDILDASDQVIGKMTEDSNGMLRRFIPLLLGKWHADLGGQEVFQVKQVFRFFTKEFTLDASMAQGKIDPRMAMAGALLALIREIAREQS
jgi:uncharacterized protein YxjI